MYWESFLSLCNKRGTTPTEVVRSLNIAVGSVTKWKNGSVPSQKNLVRIAEYFKVDVGELMGYSTTVPEYSPEEKELLELIKMLTEDEVKQARDYLGYIISKRGK